MQIKIYSIEPLPYELRGEFELPIWPYFHGPGIIPKQLLEYFQKYKIIRYQQDYGKYPSGIMIPGPDGEDYSKRDKPFDAFCTHGWIDDDDLKAMKWPMTDHEGNPVGSDGLALREKIRNQIFEKTGVKDDDWAWAQWNYPVVIGQINSRMVKLLDGYR